MKNHFVSAFVLLVPFNVHADTSLGLQTPRPASVVEGGEEEGPEQVRRTSHSSPGFVFDGALKDAREFFKPHKSGNGRACATCHRPEDHFGLTPATSVNLADLTYRRCTA